MYAADDVTYDSIGSTLKYEVASTSGGSPTPTEIKKLVVNGVTIGSDNGEITASKIVGTCTDPSVEINGVKIGAVSDGSVTMHTIGSAITISGTSTAMYDVNIGNNLTVKGKIIDSNNVSKAVSVADLADAVGQVETNRINIINNQNDIAGLKTKTTGISYSTATGTTVDGVTFNAGAVSGVKSINDKIRISDDGTVTINENATNNPVTINSKGIKVGNNSAVVSEDGFKTSGDLYVGTKTNPTEDAIDARFYVNGADGSIKAADGKFTVNGTNGETVVTGTAGTTTITGGGVTISKAASSEYVSISEGSIFATDSIKAAKIISAGLETRMADGKVVAKNGLYVGYSSTDITGATYDNSKFAVDGATGNTAVGGTLDVAGETTFANGIKTDTIVEKTANAGVTVNGNKITTDNKFNDVELKNGNVNATDIIANGALNGASLNVTNNATVGGTLGVAGATTLGSTLEVTSDTTLHGALNAKGKATFGNAPGALTEIDGDKLKTGVIETNLTQESNIGGVKMSNGKITASNMEITGAISLNDLTVNNKLTVGAFSVDKTGAVTDLQSINGVAVAKSGTGLTIGSATIGDANPFSSTGFTVDANGNVAAQNITAGTYNGNTIGADNKFNGVELKGGNVAATKVTAGTITDGIATMTGGKVTANEIAATSASLAGVTFDTNGVDFNNKDIKNVANVTAKTADLGNLHIEGHVIKNNVDAGGPIGLGTTVTVNNAGALNNVTSIDGVSVGAVTGGSGLEFGGNAVIGATGKPFSSAGFEVDGAGNVTGKSFKVNGSNYLDSTGLTTEKAVIGGVNTLSDKGIDTSGKLHVGGQATFGNSTGIHTTINGGTITSTDGTNSTIIGPNKITTKTLEADTIILNDHMQDSAGNKIEIGADGHLNVAGNNFKIDTIGQLTNEYTGNDAAGGATKTTLKTSVDGINANYTNSVNHNNNLLNINKDGVALGVTDSSNNNLGMLSADANAATMGYGTANSIVVSADTIKSALGTDVTRVMTNSTTEQSIVDKVGATSRSLKADEIVDVAGGMTITTNITGTTFSDGTTNTLIKGSAITSTKATDDTGVLDGSNLTLTNGDNKTVLDAGKVTYTGKAGYSNTAGTQTTIDGGIITTDTLKVQRIQLGEKIVDQRTGETIGSGVTLASDGGFTAAGGNFKVTGGTTGSKGSIKNVVGDATNGKTAFETNQQGANMSFEKGGIKSEVAVADDSAKISAGTSSIEVKNDGITNNGVTTFNGTTGTTTKIDGGTITTNHLITDKLTITGSGNADGTGSTTGSIAFGGNGSITSNIKDAATGKEATFKTDEKGTFTEAKDNDGNKTTNTVNAKGNTNVVTDSTNTSTATQTATSIGGVVTNGTVTMRQELTADGVKVSVDGDTANYTQITNKDVSITDQKNPGKRINLSDLGQLNDLDGELAARDEYQDNKTAVGAINAEAGIRREEVARLDNRIDDVNNRVDKVGAMAAAIASLKSIGYDPQAPSEFSIGLGQYKGETGVAMGFFHYPNKNFMINVSLSTAGGETMGGIGATWRFGHKSPQKLLEEQREAQAKKELAAAEKYQAAAKLAKEAQERAEYAAKLARQAQVSADNAKAAADATQAKHFG